MVSTSDRTNTCMHKLGQLGIIIITYLSDVIMCMYLMYRGRGRWACLRLLFYFINDCFALEVACNINQFKSSLQFETQVQKQLIFLPIQIARSIKTFTSSSILAPLSSSFFKIFTLPFFAAKKIAGHPVA